MTLDIPSVSNLRREILLASECAWRNNLKSPDIDNWLSNFDGSFVNMETDRHIALFLLNNFVYYNKSDVMHLCRVVFEKFIHHVSLNYEGSDLSSHLETMLNETLFLHLGSHGESGEFILYLFRQANDIRVSSFKSDDTKFGSAKNIVLIDDVSISGEQAEDYLESQRLKIRNDAKIYFLSLLTSESASKALENMGINHFCAMQLGDNESGFSDISRVGSGLPADQRDFLEKFSRHYGKKCASRQNSIGRGKSAHLFGFFYNTPNNTLPVFWSSAKGWKPLFRRYNKTSNHINSYGLERFV